MRDQKSERKTRDQRSLASEHSRQLRSKIVENSPQAIRNLASKEVTHYQTDAEPKKPQMDRPASKGNNSSRNYNSRMGSIELINRRKLMEIEKQGEKPRLELPALNSQRGSQILNVNQAEQILSLKPPPSNRDIRGGESRGVSPRMGLRPPTGRNLQATQLEKQDEHVRSLNQQQRALPSSRMMQMKKNAEQRTGRAQSKNQDPIIWD